MKRKAICFFAVFVIILGMLGSSNASEIGYKFSQGLIEFEHQGKYGYLNAKGDVVIPAQWDYAYPFEISGMATVFNGTLNDRGTPDTGSYGLIDKDGNYIIKMMPCSYIGAYIYADTGCININYKNGDNKTFELRNIDGERVGDQIWYGFDPYYYPMPVKDKNEKWSYLTHDGLLFPCQFDAASPYVNGLALVEINKSKTKTAYSFINMNGDIVIEGDWDYADDFSEDGFARVFKGELSKYGKPENGKFAFIDKNGEYICDYIWDKANNFTEGFAAVAKQNIKDITEWSFIDSTGQPTGKWDYAYSYKNGFAQVFSGTVDSYGPFDGLYGYINTSGEMISDFVWSDTRDFTEDHYAIVTIKKGGKRLYGIIDSDGNEVVSPIWDSIISFSDGLAIVETNGKYGYINENNELVIPTVWTEAGPFVDGVAVVHDNNTWYIIDKEGNKVF